MPCSTELTWIKSVTKRCDAAHRPASSICGFYDVHQNKPGVHARTITHRFAPMRSTVESLVTSGRIIAGLARREANQFPIQRCTPMARYASIPGIDSNCAAASVSKVVRLPHAARTQSHQHSPAPPPKNAKSCSERWNIWRGQLAAGHEPCFATSQRFHCQDVDCPWREQCMRLRAEWLR